MNPDSALSSINPISDHDAGRLVSEQTHRDLTERIMAVGAHDRPVTKRRPRAAG